MPIETGIPLYTSPEAAAYIGKSVASVRKYVQRGQLRPEPLMIGTANLFRKSELDRFLREQRAPGRPRKTG